MTDNQQAARELISKLVESEAAAYQAEYQKAIRDAYMYGTGFLVDGKRVPPGLIQIIHAPPRPTQERSDERN